METQRPDIDLAAWDELSSPCRLCELRCGVDRPAGERGPCGAGPTARVYNAFVHYGEEPELVPCFTVFVTGCNFRCPHCSDGDWVDAPDRGRLLAPEDLAAKILAHPRLRSVELVGGLPDVNLPSLARLVRYLPRRLPLVLNTNGWLTPEALALLPPLVDLLLLDVKHGNDDCARALTGVSGYLAPVERSLLQCRTTLRAGVWVRHLVLPGHLECCTRPALQRVAELAPGTVVNVLTQYRPLHRAAGDPVIGRRLSEEERAALPSWLTGLGLALDLRLDGRKLGGG